MKIEKINSYLARDQFIVEVITGAGESPSPRPLTTPTLYPTIHIGTKI